MHQLAATFTVLSQQFADTLRDRYHSLSQADRESGVEVVTLALLTGALGLIALGLVAAVNGTVGKYIGQISGL